MKKLLKLIVLTLVMGVASYYFARFAVDYSPLTGEVASSMELWYGSASFITGSVGVVCLAWVADKIIKS